LEHVYYGAYLKEQAVDGLLLKRTAMLGSSVAYDQSDLNYCLDNMCLEWSGIGYGDFRYSPSVVKMPDGSFSNDFIYGSHEIVKGSIPMETLPSAYWDRDKADKNNVHDGDSDSKDSSEISDSCDTLKVTLSDKATKVTLSLYYTVYEKTNVITRRAVIENGNEKSLFLHRFLSMGLDIPNRNFKMIHFDGGWIKEAHRHDQKLTYGMATNFSTTGSSSNRHNPGFLLADRACSENQGRVYGFNLVYSGNHFGGVELSNHDITRVVLGINPHCFGWELKQGECFEAPEVIMTFSDAGLNGMSHNFHDFINRHIVRGDWKGKERPILLNNWEAHFFKFNQKKLLDLAKQAKGLGVELFVLDDGWFGERNSDSAGLGDYEVNKKKLPQGMKGFSKKITKMGLKFGLWFEPEMVNEDSKLYREHPEYALQIPNRRVTQGRNQLVLDLCNKDVREYIINSVGKILDESEISYVKWDMNRHIADAYSPTLSNQGEFFHRYMMGLYEVLDGIFSPRPHILLESCSSGGNRFDLGMLCYSPQIWTSDDTDPMERLEIQGGISYLYPPSAMGAHVSAAPHQQTLRETPLSTRFNVSAFGCLGYELDLKYVGDLEKKEIKEQIAFYKKYRKLLQYGRFSRLDYPKGNKVIWQVVNGEKTKAVSGFYQKMATASEGYDYLQVVGLDSGKNYRITTKPQFLYVKRFGGLVKHILPIELDPNGFIMRTVNKVHKLDDCVESYEGDGTLLADGVLLNNQFVGSYYNEQTRLLGDFGSNLYVVEEVKGK
jgi:alpha-galactosidase